MIIKNINYNYKTSCAFNYGVCYYIRSLNQLVCVESRVSASVSSSVGECLYAYVFVYVIVNYTICLSVYPVQVCLYA